MSIHLVGGGWSPEHSASLYRPFLAEAEARAAGAGRVVPRVGVIIVGEDEADAAESAARYTTLLPSVAACEPVVTALTEGEQLTSAALSDIDALLVGGGLTPSYLEAVAPIVDELRLLVADGLPYLGFSAGAAIAADRALIGGWRIGGIAVAPEDAGEDLDEVTVDEGLALVDLAIDAHAAQWGTLTRLIAATEAGIVDGGVAIDEDTSLIVGEGTLRVEGAGNVWRVVPGEDGVVVSTIGG